MHLSGQTIQTGLALGIVAVAAAAVGRRLWSQIAAFRSPRRPMRRAPAQNSQSSAPSPLIQIQRKPPVHLKRPPSDGT
jgi:hypothetical protein